jgi:hypothetical protein
LNKKIAGKMKAKLNYIWIIPNFLFLILASIPANAQSKKVIKLADTIDFVRLTDGDAFHGKLEYAEKGTLTIDPTTMDEQEIDFEDIAEIRAASSNFQIDIEGKGRVIGRIYPAKKDGFCLIRSITDTLTIPFTDIVDLKRISKDFSDRFDEWVALGFHLPVQAGSGV